MSAFETTFDEPSVFSDGSYVLSRERYPTREEAAAVFAAYLEETVRPGTLREDAIRYGFASEALRDEGLGDRCWVAGATGRGAKPVWVRP